MMVTILIKINLFTAMTVLTQTQKEFFGAFGVNKWTGDVWDLWECKIISNAASQKLQTEIRKRFTLEEMKQYKQLAAIKPGCLND